MGIEDIQISEELETNAPSIKYTGNEGPKSPQEEQMIMQQQMQEMDQIQNQEAGDEQMIMEMAGGENNRVRELLLKEETIGLSEMEKEELRALIKTISASRQQQMPRQMAAYGGIMGLDGRRQYGIGSFLKKTVRKLIPNEIADIAVKAAPFVAPFNPLAAGLMSGIGGFDQTGKIGSSLKSGLMNYGMGQLARGVGGGMDNLQGMSLKVPGGSASRFGQYFSSPMQSSGGLGKYFSDSAAAKGQLAKDQALANSTDLYAGMGDPVSTGMDKIVTPSKIASETPLGKLGSKIMEYVPTSLSDLNPMSEGFGKKAVGALGIFKTAQTLLGPPEQVVDTIMKRGDDDFDIVDIRTRVTEAFKDPSGKKLAALRLEFPFLGTQASKNTAIMADGGRIGRAEGGIMDLGGMEKDYRAEGGFVPIGREEKADDVPARLSVNEFVFTADAVRNAGGGDIDKGAEVMENMMKNLEQGGQVSEESQGMSGAQQMFETSERLSGVI